MTSTGALVLRTLVVEEVRDLQFYATCVGGAVLAAFHIGGANHPAVALTVEEVIDIKVAGEHSLEKTLVDPHIDRGERLVLLRAAVMARVNGSLERKPERPIDNELVRQARHKFRLAQGGYKAIFVRIQKLLTVSQ